MRNVATNIFILDTCLFPILKKEYIAEPEGVEEEEKEEKEE